MDSILYDSFERLLTDISTPAVVREIESGTSAQPLWQAIVESGFADAMVAEDSGGANMDLSDAFSLFFLCGRHVLPVPLAQTLIVRNVCTVNGVDVPEGPIAISSLPVVANDQTIECRSVPFGKVAQWVLVPHAGPSDTPRSVLLPATTAELTETGVRGSLQAHLSWKNPLSSGAVLGDDLQWMEIAAVTTAAQMAGAMDTVLNMTVKYAGERSQFGRPIGKFQAVQQQLSVLAELAIASRIAAELGCQEASPRAPNPIAAAVAKARTSEAAGTIVSIAHAVHAAMGVTEEYDLQIYTRRLNEWRTDYGSSGYWNRRVGDAVLSSGALSTLEFMLPTFFPVTAPD